MTEQQKERMIALLIKAVDEVGESEGVWFIDNSESIELCELLKLYDTSESNIVKRDNEIQWLTIKQKGYKEIKDK